MNKKDNNQGTTKKLSFEGIEEKIGEVLTVVMDKGGMLETYTGRLIATDSEYLIFQEEKRKAHLPKNMMKDYYLA